MDIFDQNPLTYDRAAYLKQCQANLDLQNLTAANKYLGETYPAYVAACNNLGRIVGPVPDPPYKLVIAADETVTSGPETGFVCEKGAVPVIAPPTAPSVGFKTGQTGATIPADRTDKILEALKWQGDVLVEIGRLLKAQQGK